MFIKAKNKILRKYDSDFWNFLYTKPRKNKFFIYFKLSLINKLQYYNRKKFFFNKKKSIKFSNYHKNKSPISFYSNLNLLNYRRFYKKSKFFVKKIFYKNVKFKSNRIDSLFGIKTAYERYKKKIQSPFSRLKIHLKKIILFYNNFNTKKLKKLAYISLKSKQGGLNFFLHNLESRLDSIIIRLNVGTKFYVRN